MLMPPLRSGPSLAEASSPPRPGSGPQTRKSVNFPACSLPSSQWLCCHTSLCSDKTELKRGRTGVSSSEVNLFWDSLGEFSAAEQGEILIKIPSIIWEEDSLWSWEQSGKHFPIFRQAQLDICLLTLSIYSKCASVYRSFTIYNNKFTNSEFCLFDWTHLELNWPICLTVYRHITTGQIGVINQCPSLYSLPYLEQPKSDDP